MWLLSFSTALAGVPDTVRPALAPVDAPQQYAALRASRDLPADPLVCETVWTEALLCFRVWEGKRRRWVTEGDLARWQATSEELRAAVTERSLARLESLETVAIEGMNATYRRLADGDGWAAAAVLHPAEVAGRLGAETVLFAAPTDQVVLAWAGGDPDTDKVIAVGVRELYDGEQGLSVTPVVQAWSDGSWRAFGEAKPAD